jgi:uncharacterized membrane protein (Fun14 family)
MFKLILRVEYMSVDLGSIATSIGFGGIIGFLIGFTIKKVMKIVAVIFGLFIAALAYLEFHGIVNVSWNKFQAGSQGILTGLANVTGLENVTRQIPATQGIGDQIIPTIANFGIPLTGSLAAGFVFGFMKG